MDDLMTIAEAVTIIGLGKAAINNACNIGKIPYITIGGSNVRFIKRSDAIAYRDNVELRKVGHRPGVKTGEGQ